MSSLGGIIPNQGKSRSVAGNGPAHAINPGVKITGDL